MRPIIPALVLALAFVLPLEAQKLKIDTPLPELEEAARRDSTDPVALYNLGVGYMSRKKWPDADQALRAALAIDPQFARAQLALAVTRELDEDRWRRLKSDSARREDVEVTRRYYSRAFLIDPFVDVRVMALLWRVTGTSRRADGFKAFMEGRYEDAYRHTGGEIADIMKKSPRDSAGIGLLWIHTLSAVHTKQYQPAEEDLKALIRLGTQEDKGDSLVGAPLAANEYRYMLAALKQQTGALDEAIAMYQEVLGYDVSNYMAHVQLARIHESRKDWPNAVAERRRAVETNPDDASLLTDLGVTQGRSGDFNSAAETLQEAAKANPRDARPLFWLGIAELQLQRNPEARAAFEQYLAIAPARNEQQIAVAKQKLAGLQ